MNNTESINEKIIQNMIEITDFDAPELDVYARLTEAQLLNKDHPEDGLFIQKVRKLLAGHWMEDMSLCLFWWKKSRFWKMRKR